MLFFFLCGEAYGTAVISFRKLIRSDVPMSAQIRIAIQVCKPSRSQTPVPVSFTEAESRSSPTIRLAERGCVDSLKLMN